MLIFSILRSHIIAVSECFFFFVSLRLNLFPSSYDAVKSKFVLHKKRRTISQFNYFLGFLRKRIKSLSPIAVSLSVLIRCESKPTSLHVDHLQRSEND